MPLFLPLPLSISNRNKKLSGLSYASTNSKEHRPMGSRPSYFVGLLRCRTAELGTRPMSATYPHKGFPSCFPSRRVERSSTRENMLLATRSSLA